MLEYEVRQQVALSATTVAAPFWLRIRTQGRLPDPSSGPQIDPRGVLVAIDEVICGAAKCTWVDAVRSSGQRRPSSNVVASNVVAAPAEDHDEETLIIGLRLPGQS